jgi:hypothetical protein
MATEYVNSFNIGVNPEFVKLTAIEQIPGANGDVIPVLVNDIIMTHQTALELANGIIRSLNNVKQNAEAANSPAPDDGTPVTGYNGLSDECADGGLLVDQAANT